MGELVPGCCVFEHPGANWVQDLEPRGKLFLRPRWQDFVLVYFLAYSLRKQYNIFLMFHRLSIHTSDLSSLSVVLNSYVFSPVTAGLHVLRGKGELTAGGAGYTLWGLLWIKHQAHDHLQWWQCGLDDCSDLSYFCVFTLSQFDLLVLSPLLSYSEYLLFWAWFPLMVFFCSSIIFSVWGDLAFPWSVSCYWPWLPMSSPFSLWCSFQSFINTVFFLFSISICWEALTPFLTMYTCTFTRKPPLPFGSPCVTTHSSDPMEHRALPGVSQANHPAFPPHPVFQGSPASAISSAYSLVHLTFSLV